ncbi:MAG: GAF domain-containing protein, partial [Hydrogenophaga sp.]
MLDTLPQKAFDDITALASAICDTPIALISLIDEQRQWFKSKVGLAASETSRDIAFCSHAINAPDQVMVVNNALLDPRFSDNPLVLDDPTLRFYAGAPIVTNEGFALGTVCVIDREPRTLSPKQRAALQSLANLVVTLLIHEEQHTQLHQVLSRNAEQQSKLMATVTASGLDLISFVGPDYVYRYTNERYLTYWQKTASQIVGHKVSDLMGDALFETTIKPNFDRALTGEEVHYQAQIDFPGMGKRHTEVTYIPARDASGAPCVVVRVHDINALKQREEQLKHAVQTLERKTLEQDRFIHIISHDLREPINSINNFSSLLIEDPSLNLPPPAQRYLAFVGAGGQRMKSLLDDLLGFLEVDSHTLQK